MPRKFLACASKPGSRVRTKRLTGGRTVKLCWPKGSKKAIAGHVQGR